MVYDSKRVSQAYYLKTKHLLKRRKSKAKAKHGHEMLLKEYVRMRSNSDIKSFTVIIILEICI